MYGAKNNCPTLGRFAVDVLHDMSIETRARRLLCDIQVNIRHCDYCSGEDD